MKDSFTVRLAARLTLVALGVPPGFFLTILTAIFAFFMGAAIDKKIIPMIDITLDGLREGQKIDEFKRQAAVEYKRAMQRALSKEEKDAVRKDFVRTLEPIVRIGRGLRNQASERPGV